MYSFLYEMHVYVNVYSLQYSGDQDDKQWLFDNHHMPAIGGKAYILLYNDIENLANTDEYR